jgi:hypothetical protein
MPGASPGLSGPLAGGSPSPMGGASALGGGLNMGPQSDSFSGGLPGGAGGGGGGAQGMSQMLPMLLQILSLLVQMMSTLLGGGQQGQQPGQQPGGGGAPSPTEAGGGQCPGSGGGGAPAPTEGGDAPPTPGGDASPTAGGDAPPSPGGGGGGGGQGHPLGKIVVTDPAKYDKQIAAAIQKYGQGQKVDPNIIKGMIWQESKGDPLAVGSLDAQGSKGLMQVTAENAKKYGFGDQMDPAQSIGLGVKMYAEALKHNGGDVAKALGEYNQGPGAKDSPNAKTYTEKVQKWAQTFAQGPGNLPEGRKPGQLE